MESSPVLTESLQDDALKTRYDLGQHVRLGGEAGAEVSAPQILTPESHCAGHSPHNYKVWPWASSLVVPWTKTTPASRGRVAKAPRGESSPAAPAGSDAHQGYELSEGLEGVGIESGWLRVQQCPASPQHRGPMEPGWPGPSGISMGCCRSLCWRMRGSGETGLGQHWDSLPIPSCSSTLAKI